MIKKTFILAIMTVMILGAKSSMAGNIPLVPNPHGSPQSVYFGAYYVRTSFEGDIKGLDTGEGAGIRLGFGDRNRVIASELGVFKSRHDAGNRETATLTGYTFNVRLSLPISDIVSPYVFGGVGRYSLETPNAVYRDKDGWGGYQFGGGLDVHLSDYFSLNFGYTRAHMSFDQGTPGNVKLRTKSIWYDLGLAVHF